MIQIPGYRILRTLGRGGMATVYLAEQLSLHRQVALKVLSPQLAGDAAFVERFLREGRIAAQLRHRHIVAIHDVGTHQDQVYMALDYLPGGTLDGREPRAPREALRVLREIAGALDLAHRSGVVHRDIKPENILIDEDGRHVLSDFGIARMADAGPAMTREGSTVGTPAYMAPEQWRNQGVDGRADLYSLGVVLYQLLTGRLPYSGGDGWAVGMQHLQAPPPLLPSELAALQPLLDRLLCKEPGGRYTSGAALAQAIEALERSPVLAAIDSPTAATPPQAVTSPAWRAVPTQAVALFATPAETPALPPSRLRRPLVWALVALLTLTLASAWVWRGRSGAWPLAAGDTLATLAVLPCTSYANLALHQELGDTLAGELIHRIGRLRALTVIARSSSFPLRQAGLTASEIGARLGATHLVSCSIRRAPDGVRIAAELADTASGALRWSAEYERGGDDLLEIVDELALGISERLLDQLAGPDRALLIRHRTHSLEAVRLVAQARELGQRFNLESLASARDQVQQALALDPAYAAAHIALADLDAIDMQLNQRSSGWWRAQVEPRLQRALQIDPEFAPAYLLRSQLHFDRFDWGASRADLARALELEPGSPRVQMGAANFYMAMGSRERAVEHATRALRVDPESAETWTVLATALIRADRSHEALTLATQAADRFPALWTLQRARAVALERLGRCSEGLDAQQRALALSDNDVEVESRAATLYVCAGQRERAVALLRDHELRRAAGDPISDMAFAVIHLALGQRAPALDALESMLAARDARLVQWITSPLYGITTLAGEPRLVQLIEQLRLPDGAMTWQWRG